MTEDETKTEATRFARMTELVRVLFGTDPKADQPDDEVDDAA